MRYSRVYDAGKDNVSLITEWHELKYSFNRKNSIDLQVTIGVQRAMDKQKGYYTWRPPRKKWNK